MTPAASKRLLGRYLQWRWLIGLRRAPQVITASGDTRPGDIETHRAVARSCLEWSLRHPES